MADFAKAFETISDTGYLVDAAMVGSGYMSGVLTKAAVEGRLGRDLPDPVYGAPAMVGGAAMGQMEVAMGGGAYSAVAAARGAGIEATAANIVGGGN